MRALSLAFFLLLAGCSEEELVTEPFDDSYVLSRFDVDPVSEFGYALRQNPDSYGDLQAFFQAVVCSGPAPFVVETVGTRRDESAEGQITIMWSIRARGDPCSGTGEMFLLDTEGGELPPPVTGPLFIEGRSADARVDLGTLSPELGAFMESWVRLTATTQRDSARLDRGQMNATWSARFLHGSTTPETEPATNLDVAVVDLGLQPDVDEDGDGLERYYDDDEDGFVDRCVDGDGAEVEGGSCPLAAGFVDGFELILLFRVVPCVIANRD